MKNLSSRVAKKIKHYITWLLRYIHLQLFLTLCAWPILLAWGLPFSYASIVGNLIFTPFLLFFLLLSSLIFFCELLAIPYSLLTYCIEWTTGSWIKLLALSDRSWLCACPQPHKVLLIFVPLIASLIIQYKKILSPLKNMSALFSFLCLCFFILKMSVVKKDTVSAIICFNTELTLIQEGTHGIIIDPGALGRRISAPTWARYTLIPTLTKQGVTRLTIICSRPSSLVFKTLASLIDGMEVSAIYLPRWKSNLSNRGLSSWEKLLSTAQHYKTKVELIDQHCHIKTKTKTLMLDRDKKVTRKNKMAYNALFVNY